MVTWDDDSIAQLNGLAYKKNDVIKNEGSYSLVLTSEKNRTSTYNFTISHSYYVDRVIDPTCTEQGYSIYKCKSCSSTYNSDYVSSTGHSYYEDIVQATCTKTGGVHHVCSVCEDEYVTDEVQPFGHTYIESTREPSCEERGCLLHTCTVCGYNYESDIVEAIGHNYLTEITVQATCTTEGNRQYICTKCGDIFNRVISAYGHNYEITDVEGENGETIRTYTCTTCDDNYIQDLGNQYEEVSNYVEYLFAQYSPYMWYVLLATAGVWSIAMGVAIIVAKKHEEKDKARKMVVNYIVGIVVIAVILVGCPYLIRSIAALVAAT